MYYIFGTNEKEQIMEKRNLNISFYKAGNGKATRVNIPMPWLRKLGITEEEKAVELELDEEKQVIIIKKR